MFEITQVIGLCQFMDLPRRMVTHMGVTPSGALDQRAFMHNQQLLSASACKMECFGSIAFISSQALTLCVTGAPTEIRLNGVVWQSDIAEYVTYQTISVSANTEVEISAPIKGRVYYVGVSLALALPKVFARVHGVAREGFGGIHNDGQPLNGGEKMAIADVFAAPKRSALALADNYYRSWQDVINIIPSYQHAQFDVVSRYRMTAQGFTILPQSNRMGFRLQGAKPLASHPIERSQAVVCGAVQVPPNGDPIVLLADCQTLGGYPIIGCVSKANMSALVQQQQISFAWQDREMAQTQWDLMQAREVRAREGS
jgi:allophanate hydrolase subunit 2